MARSPKQDRKENYTRMGAHPPAIPSTADKASLQRNAVNQMKADMFAYDQRVRTAGVDCSLPKVGSWHTRPSPFVRDPRGAPAPAGVGLMLPPTPSMTPFTSRPTTRAGGLTPGTPGSSVQGGSFIPGGPGDPTMELLQSLANPPLDPPKPVPAAYYTLYQPQERAVAEELRSKWGEAMGDNSSYDARTTAYMNDINWNPNANLPPPQRPKKPPQDPHLAAQLPEMVRYAPRHDAMAVSSAAMIISQKGVDERFAEDSNVKYATTNLRFIKDSPKKAKSVPWWNYNPDDPQLRKTPANYSIHNAPVPASPPVRIERPPTRPGTTQAEALSLPGAQLAMPPEGRHLPEQAKRPGELNYFPLEAFDDGTYQEPGAMSKNVMLASKGVGVREVGQRAFSKWFFMDGTYEWQRAHVLEVKDDASQFLIEWERNGKQKWVTKLNILFDGEEEEVLQERTETAVNHRREAEANLLQETRVEEMDCTGWEMPEKMRENILRRVGKVAKNSRVPGSHAAAAVEAATPHILKDVESGYARTMNRIAYEASAAAVVSSLLASDGVPPPGSPSTTHRSRSQESGTHRSISGSGSHRSSRNSHNYYRPVPLDHKMPRATPSPGGLLPPGVKEPQEGQAFTRHPLESQEDDSASSVSPSRARSAAGGMRERRDSVLLGTLHVTEFVNSLGDKWGGVDWFGEKLQISREMLIVANPYMLDAMNELRWYVNDLKKLELFWVSESVQALKTSRLADKNDAAPAAVKEMVKRSSQHLPGGEGNERGGIKEALPLRNFQKIQRQQTDDAVEDVVERVHRNAGNIISDAADVQYLKTQDPVDRAMYTRFVNLVNTMVGDSIRLCLHRNLLTLNLVVLLYHQKACMMRDEMEQEDSKLSILFGSRLSEYLRRQKMNVNSQAAAPPVCPSWEVISDMWDAVVNIIDTTSHEATDMQDKSKDYALERLKELEDEGDHADNVDVTVRARLRKELEARALAYAEKEAALKKVLELTPCIFAAELVSVDTNILYNPPLQDFPEMLIAEVENLFTQLRDCRELQVVTPIIKSSCLGGSDFALDAGRKLVLDMDRVGVRTQDLYANIRALFADSQDGPLALLASLQEYSHVLADAGQIFLEQFRRGATTLADWSEAISSYKREEEEIMMELPSEVRFGIFMCDCSLIKSQLVRGAQAHATVLLDYLTGEMSKMAQWIQDQLTQLLNQLTRKPTCLKEVFECKDLIAETPGRISSLHPKIHAVEMRYDMLASFHHVLTDELVHTTWNVRALPSLINTELQKRIEQLPSEEELFRMILDDDRGRFQEELEEFRLKVLDWANYYDLDDSAILCKNVERLAKSLQHSWERAEAINANERLIEHPETVLKPPVEALQTQLAPYTDLWRVAHEWTHSFAYWMYGPLFGFDAEEVEKIVPRWMNQLTIVQTSVAPMPARKAGELRRLLEKFWEQMPIVRCLRTQGLRERHWNKICQICQLPLELDRKQITLEQLLNLGVDRHLMMLIELSTIASKEAVLEKIIDKVAEQWTGLELDLNLWKNTGALVLRHTDDLLNLLDDSMLKLQTLSVSAYIRPHADRMSYWTRQLTAVQGFLNAWLDTQSKWVYLAPLFSSQTIIRQMAQEGDAFSEVDKLWRELTLEISETPEILDVAIKPIYTNRLKDQVAILDRIQKGLNLFLDFKRNLLPRMAFLSNDELLDVLTNCQQPKYIQPHLFKMFSGIDTLLVLSNNDLLPHQLRIQVPQEEQDSFENLADFTSNQPDLRSDEALQELMEAIAKREGDARPPRISSIKPGGEDWAGEGQSELLRELLEKYSPTRMDISMHQQVSQHLGSKFQRASQLNPDVNLNEEDADDLTEEERSSRLARTLTSAGTTRTVSSTTGHILDEAKGQARGPNWEPDAGIRSLPEMTVSLEEEAVNEEEERSWNLERHQIVCIVSREGEKVVINPPISLREPHNRAEYKQVENWMHELERGMMNAVNEEVIQCLDGYEKLPRRHWIFGFPSQAVLAVHKLMWTRLLQKAIREEDRFLRTNIDPSKFNEKLSISQNIREESGEGEGGGGDLAGGDRRTSMIQSEAGSEGHEADELFALTVTERPLLVAAGFLSEQLDQLVNIITTARTKFTTLQRIIVSSMVMQEVHHRDMVQRLLDANVQNTEAFEWVRQMRINLNMLGQIEIRSMSNALGYAYEYVGSSPRLVITPLTERCFVTCITAMTQMYGGAPEGPAGTGKTETVKELAKICGRFCLVFNCSEGVDVMTMARFFRGLVQVGAWSCLDEFNRIQLDVLSVVAQQILTLNMALAAANESPTDQDFALGHGPPVSIQFDGTKLKASGGFATFITLNPMYAHRAELPENLRALFRPVAMMVPDYLLIAEVSLYSAGFRFAHVLANKIVSCLRLAAEQLSSQEHYDWSMRNLKTVLETVQDLQDREMRKIHYQDSEEALCLRALSKSNVPKLTDADLLIFKGILSDLFPDKSPKRSDLDVLVATLRKVTPTLGLQALPHFVKRCVQLYDMLEVRHGVMVLGKSGTGKTSCIRALQASLAEMSRENLGSGTGQEAPEQMVSVRTISPKALTIDRLYGHVDLASREWSDGVFASAMRSSGALAHENRDRHWIVFDGPVDTLWVENLNTLLDDSKKLCLTSGETIMLVPGMTILFEVDSLGSVSPATVSRCGMVYLDGREVGWEPLMVQWLSGLPDVLMPYRNKFSMMFKTLVTPSLDFIRKECGRLLSIPETHTLSDLIRLYDCHLQDHLKRFADLVTLSPHTMHILLESYFLFSIVNTVGAVVAAQDRDKFSDFFKQLCDTASQDKAALAEVAAEGGGKQKFVLTHPIPGQVYSYYFNAEKEKWEDWKEIWCQYSVSADTLANINSLDIPTPDTTARKYIFDVMMRFQYHVLIAGPTATGKTMCVNAYLKQEMEIAQGTEEEEAMAEDDNVDSAAFISPFQNQGEVRRVTVWPVKLSLSAEMSIREIQVVLESNLTRRQRGLYGPHAGRRCVVFVDDVNQAKQDEFGTREGLELLRQWLDHQGWYFSNKTEYCKVADLLLVAGMTITGKGEAGDRTHTHMVSDRYLRHHHLIVTPGFSDIGIKRIYSVISHALLGASDAKNRIDEMIDRTIGTFRHISKNLLPVPSRPHYCFNMRHVARIMLSTISIPGLQRGEMDLRTALLLWAHETMRVFYDGLIDREAQRWFRSLLLDDLFSFKNRGIRTFNKDDLKGIEDLVFCSFVRPEGTRMFELKETSNDEFNIMEDNFNDLKVYEMYENVDSLVPSLEGYLLEHNRMYRKAALDIVFFRVATMQTVILVRILDQDFHGHLIHVGQAGSGRRTLTALASFIACSKMYLVEMKPEYNRARWREELKDVLHQAGTLGKRTTLVVVDSPLFPEVILDNLSHLVNNGEVPGLYIGEDRNVMLEQLAPIMMQRQRLADKSAAKVAQQVKSGQNPASTFISPQKLEEMFVRRCRQNLRVVLCCAATEDGGLLAKRLRKFQALVNNMTAISLSGWDLNACDAVAKVVWAKTDLPANIQAQAIPTCANMHQTAVKVMRASVERAGLSCAVTSADYMALLDCVTKLYTIRRNLAAGIRDKYKQGVERMKNLQERIIEMQETLERLRPIMAQTQSETSSLVVEIEKQEIQAAIARSTMMKEQEDASRETEEAQRIRDQCDTELANTMPPLLESMKEMKSINKKDIAELKSLHHPPGPVRKVMECVSVILGKHPKIPHHASAQEVEDLYWMEAQRTMGDFGFLQKLLDYDKDSMKPELIAHIHRYTTLEDFKAERVQRVSKAATCMCKWVVALDAYFEVMKVVRPKRQALELADEELNFKMRCLEEAKAKLEAIMNSVTSLKESHNAMLKRREDLRSEADIQAKRMQRARQLLTALQGERLRWKELAEEKATQVEKLLGDCLLGAGLVSYMGALDADLRTVMFSRWRSNFQSLRLPSSETLVLEELLFTETDVQRWHDAGLPHSRSAVENAAILINSKRWPLIVDPQDQANAWIRRLWKGSTLTGGMVVLKGRDAFSDENMAVSSQALYRAIEKGTPVLVEGVQEEIDPLIDSLLSQKTFEQAGRTCIQVGDHTVEYNAAFMLFLTTRLPSPRYPAELLTKTVLVNWLVTRTEVSERLLSLTTLHERPELERERKDLNMRRIRDDYELHEVERRVLEVIASATGDLLEDDSILATLADSRRTSTDIKKRLQAGLINHQAIESIRAIYRDHIADRLSHLFHCLTSLESINRMYQFSLRFFLSAFQTALEYYPIDENADVQSVSRKDIPVAVRVRTINEKFVKDIYTNVCRCLFDADKLLFGMLIYVHLLEADKKIDPDELECFLSGSLKCITDKKNRSSIKLGPQYTMKTKRESFTEEIEEVKKKQYGEKTDLQSLEGKKDGDDDSKEAEEATDAVGESGEKKSGDQEKKAEEERGSPLKSEGSKKEEGAEKDKEDSKPPSLQGEGSQDLTGLLGSDNGSGNEKLGTAGEEETNGKEANAPESDGNTDGAADGGGGGAEVAEKKVEDGGQEVAEQSSGDVNKAAGDETTVEVTDTENKDNASGSGEDNPSEKEKKDTDTKGKADADDGEGKEGQDKDVNSDNPAQGNGHRDSLHARESEYSVDFDEMAAAGYSLSGAKKPVWMDDDLWLAMGTLEQLNSFYGIRDALQIPENWHKWRRFFKELDPDFLPRSWRPDGGKLTDFHFLILHRILRDESPRDLLVGIQKAIMKYTGIDTVNPPGLDLFETYRISDSKVPCIFILSGGNDPIPKLNEFAVQQARKLFHVSIGRGRGAAAKKLLDRVYSRGRWVVLENCHLAGEWMPHLQHIVDYLPEVNPHPEFRLWLTMTASPDFPSSILRVGFKLIDTPPMGVKAKLTVCYKQMSSALFETSSFPKYWRRVLFGLSLFHSVAQERANFGEIGWNAPHEFTQPDYDITCLHLHALLEQHGQMFPSKISRGPWEAFHYMAGECFYGGKITDEWDRRTIISLLRDLVRKDTAMQCRALIPKVDPLPDEGTKADVLMWIRNLTEESIQAPEVFRLPGSASKVRDTRSLDHLITSMRTIQSPTDNSGDYRMAQMYTTSLGIARDIIAKLPEFVYKINAQGKRIYHAPRDGPTVMEQKVLEKDSMKDLKDALKETEDSDRRGSKPRFRRSQFERRSSHNEAQQSSEVELLTEAMYKSVCEKEINRYSNLLEVVLVSLRRIDSALKGKQELTEELIDICRSLYNGVVPRLWIRNSYPSFQSVSFWVEDLCERLDFFQTWARADSAPNMFPLRRFFQTNSFLSSILQSHARAIRKPVDRMQFDVAVSDEEELWKKPWPDVGCYISDLWLQGAMWEKEERVIVDLRPEKSQSEMPLLWLKPVHVQTIVDASEVGARKMKRSSDVDTHRRIGKTNVVSSSKRMSILDQGTISTECDTRARNRVRPYFCPLYRTTQRSRPDWHGQQDDFVMGIMLPSKDLPDKWIQRGVALLCQLT